MKHLYASLLLVFAVFAQLPASNAQVVLSESFEGSFPPAGWTLFNAGTGNNWSQNTNSTYAYHGTKSLRYSYNFSNDANAWIFSPALSLTSGNTYRISYFYRAVGTSYQERMKVTIGSNATVAGQTTVLHDYPSITNQTYAEGVDYFIPPSTGNYNLALNCYSQANQNLLVVDSIVIKVANEPSIYSFTPKYAGIGASVEITGFNFTGATAVKFGGVDAASFTVNSPISITAVAAGGATGSVTVTTGFGTASLAGFTFLQGLTFAPLSGPVGTSLTITGGTFDPVPTNNAVFFGAVKAQVTGGSATSLNVIVPRGASYQPVSVNTNGITTSSTLPFIVTFPNGGGGFLNSSFRPVALVSTGNNPIEVASADFDDDGKVDVAMTNYNDNTISVLRNTSSIKNVSFAARVNFPAGTTPRAITIDDLDGDARPDIIVTNYTGNTISVYRNISVAGTVSFDAKVDFVSGANPLSVATGDFNGDGKADVAVVNDDNSNTVSVFKNISVGSTISFTAKVDYPVNTTPTSVAIGDLNNDGKPDLAVSTTNGNSSTTGYVSVLRNTSSGGTMSFAAKVDYATSSNIQQVALGDLNVDGKLDILATSPGTGISMLRNTSTTASLSFAAKQDLGWVGDEISVADFDGDGKPDHVHAWAIANQVWLMRNTSSGNTLSADAAMPYSTTTGAPYNGDNLGLCVADVDGDGKPDIMSTHNNNVLSVIRNEVNEPYIASFDPPGGSQGTVVTLKGAKLAGATAVMFGNVPAQSFTVVNDSTTTAVVAAGNTGAITVTTPYGTASIQRFVYPGIPSITSFSPTSDTVGAIVTISGNNFSSTPSNNVVLFGAVRATIVSASTTSLQVLVPAGISYVAITVTVNGVIAYAAKPFTTRFTGSVVAGFTANSFSTKIDVALTNNISPTGIITSDINVDGRPDIATANYSLTLGSAVIPNISSFNKPLFSTALNASTGSYAQSVTAGDFDGDGKTDLAYTTYNSYVSIFRNTSSQQISFAGKQDFYAGDNPVDVAVTDLDNDGKTDVAVANRNDNTFGVLRNNSTTAGEVSFDPLISFSTAASTAYPTAIAIGDFDGDGKQDVVVTNQTASNIVVFRNTSVNRMISFAARVTYTTGSSPVDVVVSDIDGDGKADIVVANQGSSVSVFRNTSTPGTISFGAKVDFAIAGASLSGIAVNDMDGDGKPDVGVVTSANKFSLLRNTGTPGTISLQPNVDYTLGNQPRSVWLADIDMDGKPDVLAANYVGNDISILRNQIGEPVTATLCPPVGSTTLSSLLSGGNYQWQVNTGSGFTNITDNANYTGSNTASLQLSSIPSSWYGYTYRCVVDGVNSDAHAIKFANTWTGAANTSWTNPANWSCGAIPDLNTDVIINSGTVVLSSNQTIRSLTLKAGVSVTITGSNVLTVTH
jgi:large repetitive protein